MLNMRSSRRAGSKGEWVLNSLEKEASSIEQEISALQEENERDEVLRILEGCDFDEPQQEAEEALEGLQFALAMGDGQMISKHCRDLNAQASRASGSTDEALFHLISAGSTLESALDRHTDDAGVVAACCEAFCTMFGGVVLLQNGQQIILDCMRLSLAEAIVAGLSQHVDDRQVQLFGCRVLTNLAVHKSKVLAVQDVCAAEVWATGARVAAGRARRVHANDEEVKAWAEQAMRQLC